ncbi:MAG: hypothetical protein LBP50_06530 [Tannerella sp.]|jgi:hypothetical protein|nr:hypothetical protein [Tannerella sp.]
MTVLKTIAHLNKLTEETANDYYLLPEIKGTLHEEDIIHRLEAKEIATNRPRTRHAPFAQHPVRSDKALLSARTKTFCPSGQRPFVRSVKDPLSVPTKPLHTDVFNLKINNCEDWDFDFEG